MDSSNDSSEAQFPTEWHMVDSKYDVQVRQMSEDTFQLNSPSHSIFINSWAFDLYRTDTEAFEQWCVDNRITAVPRLVTRDGQS